MNLTVRMPPFPDGHPIYSTGEVEARRRSRADLRRSDKISVSQSVQAQMMKSIDLVKSFGALANVAVLIGIALLLVELDQNGDLLRAQIHQARSDGFESLQTTIADSEHFAPAWRKFQNAGGPQDISAPVVRDDLERARIGNYLVGRLSGFDNLFYQYRNGLLDEEFYETRVVRAVEILDPTFLELGLVDSPALTPSFLAESERIRLGD